MKMMRELLSATFVAAGLAVMCGAGLVATESAAKAYRVAPGPIITPVSGTCVLTTGGGCTSNSSDPCTGSCKYNNGNGGCDCV